VSTRSSQKRNHYTADINKSSTNPDLNKTSSDKCIYEYSQVTHSRLHFTIEGRDDVMTPKNVWGPRGSRGKRGSALTLTWVNSKSGSPSPTLSQRLR